MTNGCDPHGLGIVDSVPPIPESCVHRGEQLDLAECSSCSGSVRIKTFACSIHGECTITKDVRHQVCNRCRDYSSTRHETTRVEESYNQDVRKIVIPFPGIHCGGVEYWSHCLAKYLDRSRWRVSIAAETSGAHDVVQELGQVADVVIGPGAVEQECRTADVVLLWAACRGIEAAISCPVRVFVAHGFGKWTDDNYHRLAQLATHQVGVSRDAATTFRSGDHQVIHGGVDLDRLVPTRPRDEIRESLGVTPGEVLVSHIGRVSPEKNPFAVARACRILGSPYRAAIIGECTSAPMAREKRDHVAIYPGAMPVADALAASDVVVSASPAEGGPLIALEAMAFGVPLVSTLVGVVQDIEHLQGKWCETIDPKASDANVAAAIRMAIKSNQRHQSHQVRELFRGQAMAAKWATSLTSFCGKSN